MIMSVVMEHHHIKLLEYQTNKHHMQLLAPTYSINTSRANLEIGLYLYSETRSKDFSQ